MKTNPYDFMGYFSRSSHNDKKSKNHISDKFNSIVNK